MYTEKDIEKFDVQISNKQKELEALTVEILRLKEQYKEIARQKHVAEIGKRQLLKRLENNKNAESIVYQTFGKHTDELSVDEKHQYEAIINRRRKERKNHEEHC